MNAVLWGMLLRILQAFLQGAPFIFTGLCIAGLLDRLMGHAATRRMFGSNSVVSLAQSWLIGMLLPGCSLGVIPICRKLRSSGISVGTIFAFASPALATAPDPRRSARRRRARLRRSWCLRRTYWSRSGPPSRRPT